MTNEMKLLTALTEALGFEIKVTENEVHTGQIYESLSGAPAGLNLERVKGGWREINLRTDYKVTKRILSGGLKGSTRLGGILTGHGRVDNEIL